MELSEKTKIKIHLNDTGGRHEEIYVGIGEVTDFINWLDGYPALGETFPLSPKYGTHLICKGQITAVSIDNYKVVRDLGTTKLRLEEVTYGSKK